MQVLRPQAPHKPDGPCQLLPIHMNGPKPYSSNFIFPVKTRKFQHSSRYGMYAGCNILSAWTVSIWTLTLILYIPRHFSIKWRKKSTELNKRFLVSPPKDLVRKYILEKNMYAAAKFFIWRWPRNGLEINLHKIFVCINLFMFLDLKWLIFRAKGLMFLTKM